MSQHLTATLPANNFNLLRFLAAAMVVYTHSYGLTGQLPTAQHDPFSFFIYALGNVGVDSFFVISGFLITKSYLNRQNLWIFLRARCLRLYPGLLCALLFSGLIIGPYCTTLPLSDYLQSPELKAYFFYNLSLIKAVVGLPGVFPHNVYHDTINGSLWTLPAEARMYLIIAAFGVTGILSHRLAYTLSMLFAAMLYGYDKSLLPLIADNPLYFELSWFFFSGSLLYIYQDKLHLTGSISLFLLCCMIFSHLYYPVILHPLYFFALPYLILCFAFAITQLHAFNKLGDYSYGIYIYAFPIQQTIINHYPSIEVLPCFYTCMLFSLCFAIPSWHCLEKPALAYK